MKRLLQTLAACLFTLLGLTSGFAQTDVVVTPQLSNPAAVIIGVTFNLTSDWQISSTPFEKSVNSAGMPVWSLNTIAARSVTAIPVTLRKVELRYGIGAVAAGTTGRILWRFNGQTLSESNFTVPNPNVEGIGAAAAITITAPVSATAVTTTAKVRLDFKEYATITGQKVPVKDGTRFILEATASRVAVIQIFPPPPLPSVDLNYNLGAVAAGNYTAVFKLNGTTLAEKPFTISSLPPTVDATVTGSFETTSAGSVAKLRLVLPDPYYEMTDPGTPVISGGLIKTNATLTRINTLVALPAPKVIEKSCALGVLAPGSYLFQCSINNSLKLSQTFKVEGPPPTPLQLAFVEVRPASTGTGRIAEVGVIVSDPNLTITNWGTARREGTKFTATLTTGPRPATDPAVPAGLVGADGELANNPLIKAQALVAAPGDAAAGAVAVRIERFRYDLGTLEAGTYEFEILNGGKSAGLRQFKIQPTPPPPGPVVAAIEIVKTSTGPWNATVRLVLPPGQTVLNWGEVKQDSNQFKVSLTLGATPVALGAADSANAAVVRPLESHTYSLGTLTEGSYSFAVCQGENQLALRPFVVGVTPPPPVINQPRLAFIETKQGDASTAAEVGVTLPQPGFSITSWGDVTRDGSRLTATIQVKRDEAAPAVMMPPKLERHVYSLGALAAGEFKLTISYQTVAGTAPQVLGARVFAVAAPPPPPPLPVNPLPIIVFLVNGSDAQGSFIDLGLAWPLPGWAVTDWGTPVQEKNAFRTALVIGKAPTPVAGLGNGIPGAGGAEISLIPADGNINHAMVDPAREIGGWPTSLVRHRYLLGVLPPGNYQFAVAIGSQVLARRAFTVRETVLPKPFVTTTAEPVRRAGTVPAPFSLTFTARSGWPADPTAGTVTVKGPRDFTAAATRLSGGIISLDPLGILAKGQYELAPPGGAWDAGDSGRYDIFIDPATVRDRQGQSPPNPVGQLLVQILPVPPPPPPALKAEVVAAMADGQWTVDVSFPNTGGWWQAEWGTVKPRSPVFFAEAKLTTPPVGSLSAIPAEFSHRYPLGELKPGVYSFVFRSSAGHTGQASLTVPGVEPPTPFDAWKFNAFGAAAWNSAASDDMADTDGDGQSTLAEFALGGDPRHGDIPDYRAEIVSGPNGTQHLALQYRRSLGSETSVTALVEMSANMEDWQPAMDQVEIIPGPPDPDGTQPITARQTAPLSLSRYPYLRLRLAKTGN